MRRFRRPGRSAGGDVDADGLVDRDHEQPVAAPLPGGREQHQGVVGAGEQAQAAVPDGVADRIAPGRPGDLDAGALDAQVTVGVQDDLGAASEAGGEVGGEVGACTRGQQARRAVARPP